MRFGPLVVAVEGKPKGTPFCGAPILTAKERLGVQVAYLNLDGVVFNAACPSFLLHHTQDEQSCGNEPMSELTGIWIPFGGSQLASR